MIGIKLQGRLGNQLFQYAFIYAAAKVLNTSFYIDQTKQVFILQNYFNIPSQLSLFLEDYVFSIKGFRNFFSYHLNEKYHQFIINNFIKEKVSFTADTEYQNIAPKIKDHTLFEGYFQSEMYFAEHTNEIRRIFSIKKKIQKQYSAKYSALFRNKKKIAVHIRKGDYSNLGHLGLGGEDLSLSGNYYHKIIESLQSTDTLFIFISDDAAFVKKEFDYLDNKIISDDDLINDFQHLLNADICIIANSTFSWWAAWLNGNPLKKIYAPKYFLGHRINKTWPPEIYPPGWQLINVNNET